MNILSKINADKKREVAQRKQEKPLSELKKQALYSQKPASLVEHLLASDFSGIIAEHKRRSPSKGVINEHSELLEVVLGYQLAGASAVSVLTDTSYFGGSLMDLQQAAEVLMIPVLRKDFIIDEYQIHEAKAYGASAILLIAASLSKAQAEKFTQLAHDLDMEVLFEIHSEEEALLCPKEVDIVGVNNRNLKTFTVDLEQSIRLISKIPQGALAISESGINSVEDIQKLKKHGFKGFLMGERFMREEEPAQAFKAFVEQLKAKKR